MCPAMGIRTRKVAFIPGQTAHAAALGAQNQRQRALQIDRIERLLRLPVGAHDPNAASP